jgi:hypothetical protein
MKASLISKQQAWSLWLAPVTLTNQEAEIRTLSLEANPGKVVRKSLSLKRKPNTKKGWWSDSSGRAPA